MRTLLWAALPAAALALAVTPTDAYALMIAMRPAPQRALSADVVVVGKVASVTADPVDAASPYPGAKDKVKYKVATVKISDALAGAGKLTEIKVGFALPPKVDPNVKGPIIRPGGPRGPALAVELKEGQELLLFLTKHPGGEFYIFSGMSPPVDVSNEQGKKELEAVKKVTTAIADPTKGLKSDKAEVRAETAVAMVMKYRSYPEFAGEVDQVEIGADESKLLLKGLAEAEWSNNLRPGPVAGLSAVQAFGMLGLTPKDGWVQPVIVNQPGAPPVDYGAVMKDAFTKWLDGAGKDYKIKKVVPKKASEK